MRWCWLPLLTIVAGLGGCSPDGVQLVVDLRTDFVPGAEFRRVQTALFLPGETAVSGEAERRDLTVDFSDSFVDGHRVGEFEELATGTRATRVRLLDTAGGILAERTVRVSLESSYALTVTITRDCAVVSCPGDSDAPTAVECVGGVCVEPGCASLTEPGCGAPECADDAGCASMSPCAVPRCLDGVCLYFGDESCGSDAYCHPEMGCLPRTGGVDAGDAGDAATDTSVADAGDAATDTSVADTGPDAPVDTGTSGCPGECTPDEVDRDAEACGTCGSRSRSRTCGPDCSWGAWGTWSACAGDVWCDDFVTGGRVCPGSTGSAQCPLTSMPTCSVSCTCSTSGDWTGCASMCVC